MPLVVLILLIVFVVGPIARAYADRVRRGANALPGAAEETARLREEVDRLAAEVARLSEEQSFMLRLLAPGEGTPSPGPSPQGGGENGGTTRESPA
ncbi:MAG TPA: hypothetical protein VGR37_10450 [Longimicrobiaceae bacterium]|nr:hypothetical protein [Longimicrobiaceae bacterium]